MFLQAELKCEYEGTPYRVYINDELITERFFAIPPGLLKTIKYQIDNEKFYVQPIDCLNILSLEITDNENYNIKIESLSDKIVHLHNWTVQEKPYEDK